jgi:hypothetical protein
MKNRITSIILPLLALLAVSCQPDREFGQGTEARVKIDLRLDSFNLSRSSSTAGDSEIRTVQLFVTDGDGDIVDEDFTDSASGLSFKGRTGETYHLYVFANNPSRIEGLETEDDILGWEYRTDLSGHFPSGFPMAGDKKWTVTGNEGSVGIELTRLVSKLQLTLDKSEMDLHGIFTLTSVRLRNCPSVLKPFQAGQKAQTTADVGDGDLASEDDITKLNAGESVCFYILENMQGDLLPSNSDPWAKTPSSLASGDGLCTYLEAEGTYVSSGYSGNDCYRMYLGSDNVKNFDLCRNSLYRLTLSPTEDNMRKSGNWKITASDWNDSRRLYFSASSINILPGGSTKVTLTCSPGAFTYSLSEEGFEDAMLSYTVSGNTITITCAKSASKGKTASLTATSWDGRVSAVCNLRTGEGEVIKTTIDVRPDNRTIFVGDTIQYKAYAIREFYEDGVFESRSEENITTRGITKWSVDKDPKCVSVSNEIKTKGLATGLYEGITYVVCIYSAYVGSEKITVIKKPDDETETAADSK